MNMTFPAPYCGFTFLMNDYSLGVAIPAQEEHYNYKAHIQTQHLPINQGPANNYKVCYHLTHNQSLRVLQWRGPGQARGAIALSLTFCFFCVKAKEE
jgi:hypothetical protein